MNDFTPIRLSNGTVIRTARKEIRLPGTGERFGGTDWTNPEKLSDLARAGITFKRYVDDRPEPGEFYEAVKGTPEETAEAYTETYAVVPAMTLPELQALLVERVKAEAGSLLAPTDWYVIRGTEDAGRPIPASVSAYRYAVRQASDDIESTILAETDYDALASLDWTGMWPEAQA
jgi:hypothetical protein